MRNIWHLRIKQLRIKHSRVTYAINPVNGTQLRHISPSDSDRVLFDACTPAHNTSCCHTTRSSSSSSFFSFSSLGENLRPTRSKIKYERTYQLWSRYLFNTSRAASNIETVATRANPRGETFTAASYRDFCCDNGALEAEREWIEAECICWSRICWLGGTNLRIVEQLHLLYIVEKLHECFQVSRILELNREREKESGKICMDIAKSAISRITR